MGIEEQPEGDSEDRKVWFAVLSELQDVEQRFDETGDCEAVLRALSAQSCEVLLDFRAVYGLCQDIRQKFYLGNQAVPEGLIAGYVHYRSRLAEHLYAACGWGDKQVTAALVALEHRITDDWRSVAVAVGGAAVRDALADSPKFLLYHSLAEMERITRLATPERKAKIRFQQCWEEIMQTTRQSSKCLEDLIAVMSEAWQAE